VNLALLLVGRSLSILGCLTIAFWALAAARARPDVIPVWIARKLAILMAFDAAINLSAIIVLAGHVTQPQTTWLFVCRGLAHLLFAARLFTVRRDLTHVLTAEQAAELARANRLNQAMLEGVEARQQRTWQTQAAAAGWRPPS
jgi:hypothetical protein